MRTGIELIKEVREKCFESSALSNLVFEALLKKSISQIFEGDANEKLQIERLAFIGAVIAAEIDRLQGK